VRTLKSGDHFGELALINNMKRSLSVKISSEEGCNLLSLDRETFIRILGSINDHLKKNYD
jgi:CRP-like cAMP-binding protein